MSAADYQGALVILRTLKALGHEAWLAGGCVRDRLLGRQPKDYDIATSARPEQVSEIFERVELVGAAFGVTLVIHEGRPYEVATFRADGPTSDGRHPTQVRFTSVEEDAARRDFTVNAMYYDPDQDLVLDLHGGQADLAKGVLRCVGDPLARFEEDRLRVLRAVRFSAQLGFEIEAKTLEAVRAFAGRLDNLAYERVTQELTKLLRSPRRRWGLETLDSCGILNAFLPELEASKGCAQPPQYHPEGDVWEHTLRVVDALRDPSAALAWAALLHDVGKPATFSHEAGDRIRFNGHEGVGATMSAVIADRLRFSGDLKQAVTTLVADHLRFNPIAEMRLATLKRLLRRDDILDLLELLRADCLGSHGDMSIYELALARHNELTAQDMIASLRPAALVDGEDLIALGYAPGPLFKEMLSAVEDEQLEGRLTEKDKALAWVETHYPR